MFMGMERCTTPWMSSHRLLQQGEVDSKAVLSTKKIFKKPRGCHVSALGLPLPHRAQNSQKAACCAPSARMAFELPPRLRLEQERRAEKQSKASSNGTSGSTKKGVLTAAHLQAGSKCMAWELA